MESWGRVVSVVAGAGKLQWKEVSGRAGGPSDPRSHYFLFCSSERGKKVRQASDN